MNALTAFNLAEFANTLVSLTTAFVLGTAIGAERQYRQRTAGLRTAVLVAVGAAAFVDLGMRLEGTRGAIQVTAYVVSGIGFLGAGVIMKEGMNVRGLNTAATLWCSAAVGAFAGADLPAEAVLLAIIVLAGNTLLRPLVNAINRWPIDETQTEANYEVRVTVPAERLDQARELVTELLEKAHYPPREIDTVTRADDRVEVVAGLSSTAVEPAELDAVAAQLEAQPFVMHATWTIRTSD
ncbi:MgtC/SapB family protein [Phreatobacter sp. AB_2022a]|uniref:MgtC/SapB family protein n=1 Tax=Phreatobacter sp. AB_2022a TaxID=3003134 RepID=UPI00057118DB|nr:MgtC/SapB family protein [Phreatobacter sp. AB_2022a]MCZ0733521.1 MgtC/SapB family protein [Phreatobacter sp. AB_2022a]CEJ13057.1 putative Mg(2+) transport ATPase [bacterium YEK0313]